MWKFSNKQMCLHLHMHTHIPIDALYIYLINFYAHQYPYQNSLHSPNNSFLYNKPSRYKIVFLINILSHGVYTDHHWTRGGMILSCGNIITAIISTTTTIMKCIIIIMACKCDITCIRELSVNWMS